jgi:hypothetical protein
MSYSSSIILFFHVHPSLRERAYRTVAQQWTSALAPLFRLSGVMSQYTENTGISTFTGFEVVTAMVMMNSIVW